MDRANTPKSLTQKLLAFVPIAASLIAAKVRHTLGARISRPVATEWSGLNFDYEGIFQFGTIGYGNIRLWTVASETGYRFTTVRLKPRFSAKTDISSGDNPSSKTLGTFNPPLSKSARITFSRVGSSSAFVAYCPRLSI
jgi:Alginate export